MKVIPGIRRKEDYYGDCPESTREKGTKIIASPTSMGVITDGPRQVLLVP